MRLADIIRPLTVDQFIDEYWEKKTFFHQAEDRGRFDALCPFTDLDRLFGYSAAPHHYSLVSTKDTELEALAAKLRIDERRKNLTDLAWIYESFSRGKTLVWRELQQLVGPIAVLRNHLQRDLGHPVRINMYTTPSQSTGFNVHYDGHDVLILQLHGTKRWRIYEHGAELPLPFSRFGITKDVSSYQPGEVTEQLDLMPGDLLYIPRGVSHSASALGQTSVHLTVGLYPITWETVLDESINVHHERKSFFDEALPVGLLTRTEAGDDTEVHARLENAIAELDLPAAIDVLRQRTLTDLAPLADRHFADIFETTALRDDTVLRQRRGQTAWVRPEEDGIVLCFAGGEHRTAAEDGYPEALRFVAETERFSARDLPGALDPAAKLNLVRDLARAGYLCRADAVSDGAA